MQGARALLSALEGAQRVLLTGPRNPDGDSLGACLALLQVLERRGLRVDVTGRPSYQYTWMPHVGRMLPDEALAPVYDAVVVLDGDRFRLTPGVQRCFAAAAVKGIVDHHGSTHPEGYTHPWLEPHATSTCEMLYDALVPWEEPLDADLASCLYVGAIFDTGGFRYGNTTPATHRMAAALLSEGIDHAAICARVLIERRHSGMQVAAHVYATMRLTDDGQVVSSQLTREDAERLGMVDGDLEGVVERLVYTQGVETAVLVIERDDDIKLSFRSRGRVDVARVAASLHPTGGGHRNAAGVCLDGSVTTARERAVRALVEALRA